jgi:hypothetical protein
VEDLPEREIDKNPPTVAEAVSVALAELAGEGHCHQVDGVGVLAR